jgi:hypothetical protein
MGMDLWTEAGFIVVDEFRVRDVMIGLRLEAVTEQRKHRVGLVSNPDKRTLYPPSFEAEHVPSPVRRWRGGQVSLRSRFDIRSIVWMVWFTWEHAGWYR